MRRASPVQIEIDPQWEQQVDQARLARAVQAVFTNEQLGGEPRLTLVIVGDEEMTRLHESYRNEPGTTDVLTFPYEDGELEGEMTGYLGDIIICYDQAERQGAAEGHDVQAELELLAVHGTLHLLGYDDETPEEKQQMWAQQRQVMEQLGLGHVAPKED